MSMKLDELTHGVPKGSQKRYKHPMATDDPKKYVGKWEAYDTPQGLSRVKKKKVKESLTSPVPYQWVEQGEKGWYAKFQSGTEKFFVAIAPTTSNPKLWTVMWDTEWFGVKKSVQEVFATILAVLKDFFSKNRPDMIEFKPNNAKLMQVYKAISKAMAPELKRLGYDVDYRKPTFGVIRKIMHEDTEVSYVTRRAPTQNAIGAEELYPTDVVAQRKSKKAPLKTVRQSVKALGGKLPRLDETIRKPQFGILNIDYEVQDEAGNVIGVCEIHDNVIEKLRTKITDEEYLGKILRNLLSVLVREADRIKAPLRMQLQPGSRDDLKRFLERFGFRHVGDNIMKRIEGSVTPPSVIMATGINGSDEA
jgi:hypothetical protein